MICPRFAGREIGVDLPGPGKLVGTCFTKDGRVLTFGRAVDDRLVIPADLNVGDRVRFDRLATADDAGASEEGVVTAFSADALIIGSPKPQAPKKPEEAPKA